VSPPSPGHAPDDKQLHEKATELNDKKDNETANPNRMIVYTPRILGKSPAAT
jgi:hypothetical protein